MFCSSDLMSSAIVSAVLPILVSLALMPFTVLRSLLILLIIPQIFPKGEDAVAFYDYFLFLNSALMMLAGRGENSPSLAISVCPNL